MVDINTGKVTNLTSSESRWLSSYFDHFNATFGIQSVMLVFRV